MRGLILKFKGLLFLTVILCILFLTSAVSAAEDNSTDDSVLCEDCSDLDLNNSEVLSVDNTKNIYVDNDNGNDLNDGKSQSSSVKSLSRALSLSDDDACIYVSNGNYNGLKNTELSITKSVSIIGSEGTAFDGLDSHFIFNIADNVKVTFKNIKFINAYKKTSFNNPSSMYGAALEINNAQVLIDNCSFIKNNIDYESAINKFNYGGAISNLGDLTIINSYFNGNHVSSTSGLFSYGGAIYNKGKLLINSTKFYNSSADTFSYGGVIYNDGNIIMDNSIIANSTALQESRGSAIYNQGNFTLLNSIIENNNVSRANFYYIYGTIYNYGNLVGYGNIFRNNAGVYEAPNPEYRGSPNIFNTGNLNLTYNVFVDNAPFNGIASDVYMNGGKVISLDDNWWSTNEDPYTKNKINIENNVNSWFVFNMLPEYSALNIGESLNINAFWSLTSTLNPKINMFPILNVTFTTVNRNVTQKMVDGQTSFIFDYSQNKGLYKVVATMGEFNHEVLVDVGKIISNISVEVTDNVTYTDNVILTVDVTGADGNVPQGNVSVIVDKTKYIINLTNGKGLLNLSRLDPNNYLFKICYEGSDDYFKSFKNVNVTVNKAPTSLNITFPDIKIDQKGVVSVNLGPSGVQGQAYLYIDGVRKKVLYLYNGQTNVSISNFAEGEYNVTVEFWGTKYYEASSASTSFKVTKYESSLNVTANDIHVGDNQTISIKVNPSNLRGEAILNINGVNKTIFLDSEVTDISISNLNYGTYDVWVFFPENQKYNSCNASTTFKVLRTLTELDVDIIEDGFNGTITVKTNYTNCSGYIGVYVNYRLYYSNLTDGVATVKVNFDKGTNFIYVFYDGDDDYEASSWNTTLGVAEEFILIGLNSTGYEHNNFNYTIHLIEYNGISMPNRKVSVKFNNEEYTITTNEDGVASLPLNLNAGSYEISATYKNQTVFNTLTVKEIEFNVEAEDSYYNSNETIRVTFEKNVTGKVNIFIDGVLNETVDIVDGIATCTISSLKVGSYELVACYMNDYFKSDEVKSSFEVKKANVTIDAMIPDVVYGDDGNITVVLPSDATGGITIIVDGASQDKDLINGVAYLDVPSPEKGVHNVSIIYGGDSNYNSASLNSTFSVKDAYSDIKLLINGSYNYGENITVVAILNETATGEVTFSVGGLSKSIKINNGIANWTFSGIDVGKYEMKASYLGDSTFISSANSTSFEVLKANSSIQLFVNEVYLGENILIYAVLSENATGGVSFSITNYYSPRVKAISNGVAVWYISPLDTGKYDILASYGGDRNYLPSNTSYLLDITQRKSVLKVDINDVGINERLTARVRLTTSDGQGITGQVLLIINSRTYRINVNNGVGNYVIGKIGPAKYSFNAIYEGSDEFSKASVSGEFRVVDDLLNLTLSANNASYYYGTDKQFVVSALDDNNKPVSGVDIIVKLAGVTYNKITDDEGKVYIPINLAIGKYTAEIIFDETLKYHGVSKNATIEMLSTIESIDVVSLFNTTAQYFAIFTDSNGKALGNRDVTFTIGDKSYTTRTLPNGITRININFSPGNYVISTVNPATGQKVSNTIFIFLKLMENKNIVTYFGAKQVYKVRAYDDNGNPVGAGQIVTFKVNGKTYKIKTDKNGYATCKVNLKAKTYTITATFGGYKVSNKIVVKPVLTAKNISVKKGKIIKFKVKLVNTKGKSLKNKKITFKFKGKTYKVKTNKKGVATLKIKLKLKVGKYKIRAKYGKSTIKKTIKVKK